MGHQSLKVDLYNLWFKLKSVRKQMVKGRLLYQFYEIQI